MSGVLTAILLFSCMFGSVVLQDSSDCGTTPLPNGTDIVVNGTILRSPVTSRGIYPANTDVFWNVIAPNDYCINIEFLCSFGLGPGFDDRCYDYVKIKSANGFEQTFCTKMPEPVLIADSSATIYFHSDLVLQDVGFVAEITFISNDTRVPSVECTSADTQTNFDGGTILRSPVLTASGRSYPANTDFSSNVIAPKGYFLGMEFICAFGIQGTEGSCNDYVQLTSSPIDFDEIYCGESPPDPFIVQSNELSIKFHSDMYIEDVGYVLKITYIKSSEDLTTTSNTADFTTTSTTSGTTAKSMGLILAGVSAFTVLLTVFFKYF